MINPAQLSLFEIAALLFTLSALFGWMNLRFLKLPHTIGLLVMALAASVILLVIHKLAPQLGIVVTLRLAVVRIDFNHAVMNGMLAFLLFAGALHVDFNAMRTQKWAIALMATIGVVISTIVVGTSFWLVANAVGFEISLQWALVFGALISPTDPVAVLSLLKTINIPDAIKAKIAGESLLNDGVAVVAYSLLIAIALGTDGIGTDTLSLYQIGELLFYEAICGGLFGLAAGWLAYRLMLSVDDHIVEILLSLGACAATYALAMRLHMSGPIAVVIAGLFIGNRGATHAMSEKVREHLFTFWEVIDELLNSVLFLLIGLEVLVLTFDPSDALLVAASIPIVLLGRLVSVWLPISLLAIRQTFSAGSIPVLTWGGLRGGVSVALALALPESAAKPVILTITYAVVIFSIVVQGLTVKWVIRKTVDVDDMANSPAAH